MNNWAVEVYLGACGLLLLYYLLIFSRFLFFKSKQYPPEHLPAVSVIICARNEAENLLQNLKMVLIQNYPKFEVIVVNDQSEDETAQVVQEYIARNPNLRLINIRKDIEKPLGGKKFPLKVGIEAASYDIIVTTDTDCKPLNPKWLRFLVMEFVQETKLVLGFAPFNKLPGFLNKLIRYDNTLSALNYFSFALAGMPYKGVGRNMAFRKNSYTEWNGYSKRGGKIQAGDDVLFVNAVAKKRSTEIAINKESFIYTQPKTTFGEWLAQRARHAQTNFYYKFYHQFILLLPPLATLILYFFPFAFIFYPEESIYAAIAGGTVYIFRLFVHTVVSNKLDNGDLKWYIIFLDLAYIFTLPILFFKSILSSEKEWK